MVTVEYCTKNKAISGKQDNIVDVRCEYEFG